jgi:NADH-quinone oxidoreductase subunit M
MLVWFILLPLIGGILAWLAGRRNSGAARWISVLALAADLALLAALWALSFPGITSGEGGAWIIEVKHRWVPQLGIGIHLGLDGLSLLLAALTLFLGILAVISSWTEITDRVGFFHLNLLLTLSGVLGVFLALDLFLFYFFWELMLVPMYFLIAIWGHEHRSSASMKFFLFTQLSGLLMFVSILALYFIHGQSTGTYTFDYMLLLGTPMSSSVSAWLMLGFFIAFAVKLPVIPLHTWLPDAHTEAPTAGSVVLAGLLLKTGAYGMLRFMLPLFPDVVSGYGAAGMMLGTAGILYGAILAFAQNDIKRLVAYTSVSHMGFVLLGVSAGNELALQGVIMQMLCHGLSTGGLFILAGALQERFKTRDMDRMGGLWSVMPRMGGFAMVFAMASLGLPGLGNFVGEFLVLFGAYQKNIPLAAISAAGLVAATLYSFRLIQRVFHGAPPLKGRVADATPRELSVAVVMTGLLLILGLFPQPVLQTSAKAVKAIEYRLNRTGARSTAAEPEIRVARPEGIKNGRI